MQLAAESGERRALVRALDLGFLASWYGGQAAANRLALTMPLEREPVWERTVGMPLPEWSPAAAAALLYDYTAAGAGIPAVDVAGDVGGRLGLLRVAGNSLGRLWLGPRSAQKHGTPANFVPIWECECAGATLGTDAALTTDSSASPGSAPPANTKVRITPGTATLVKRLSIQLQDISANESDQFGRFLWLLRASVTADATYWRVHLRHGYTGMSDTLFVRQPAVTVGPTGSLWDYFEMGLQDIPLRDVQALPVEVLSGDADQTYEVQIWAERLSGAGNLDLDCLCPVPVDEGLLKVWGFQLAGATHNVNLAESPLGRWQALTRNPTTFVDLPPLAAFGFRLPPGDGRLVIVYAAESVSVLANTIGLNSADSGLYYPAWRSLRGGA